MWVFEELLEDWHEGFDMSMILSRDACDRLESDHVFVHANMNSFVKTSNPVQDAYCTFQLQHSQKKHLDSATGHRPCNIVSDLKISKSLLMSLIANPVAYSTVGKASLTESQP